MHKQCLISQYRGEVEARQVKSTPGKTGLMMTGERGRRRSF